MRIRPSSVSRSMLDLAGGFDFQRRSWFSQGYEVYHAYHGNGTKWRWERRVRRPFRLVAEHETTRLPSVRRDDADSNGNVGTLLEKSRLSFQWPPNSPQETTERQWFLLLHIREDHILVARSCSFISPDSTLTLAPNLGSTQPSSSSVAAGSMTTKGTFASIASPSVQ